MFPVTSRGDSEGGWNVERQSLLCHSAKVRDVDYNKIIGYEHGDLPKDNMLTTCHYNPLG